MLDRTFYYLVNRLTMDGDRRDLAVYGKSVMGWRPPRDGRHDQQQMDEYDIQGWYSIAPLEQAELQADSFASTQANRASKSKSGTSKWSWAH